MICILVAFSQILANFPLADFVSSHRAKSSRVGCGQEYLSRNLSRLVSRHLVSVRTQSTHNTTSRVSEATVCDSQIQRSNKDSKKLRENTTVAVVNCLNWSRWSCKKSWRLLDWQHEFCLCFESQLSQLAPLTCRALYFRARTDFWLGDLDWSCLQMQSQLQ